MNIGRKRTRGDISKERWREEPLYPQTVLWLKINNLERKEGDKAIAVMFSSSGGRESQLPTLSQAFKSEYSCFWEHLRTHEHSTIQKLYYLVAQWNTNKLFLGRVAKHLINSSWYQTREGNGLERQISPVCIPDFFWA